MGGARGGAFGSSWREEVWAAACSNARRGDIRLLVVADSVPWSLCQTLAFIPSTTLIGAVEVTFHDTDTGGVAVGGWQEQPPVPTSC